MWDSNEKVDMDSIVKNNIPPSSKNVYEKQTFVSNQFQELNNPTWITVVILEHNTYQYTKVTHFIEL